MNRNQLCATTTAAALSATLLTGIIYNIESRHNGPADTTFVDVHGNPEAALNDWLNLHKTIRVVAFRGLLNKHGIVEYELGTATGDNSDEAFSAVGGSSSDLEHWTADNPDRVIISVSANDPYPADVKSYMVLTEARPQTT